MLPRTHPITIAAAGGLALAAKLLADALPDAAVASAFMRPAARLAALHLGAAFDPSAMLISARGVTLEVVRACSATDFFAMVFTLFAFALPVRPAALRAAASLAAAWPVAVAANAARLILLVHAYGLFPRPDIPAVHMAVGIAVFLPVFALLWYTLDVWALRKGSPGQDFQDTQDSRKDSAHGNATPE